MTATTQRSDRPYVRSQTVENSLSYMGSIVTFLISQEETGGNLTAFAAHSRAGGEPPPHVHEHEDETFHILDGELEFHVEGEQAPFTARAGDFVYLPHGKAHGLLYRTDTARLVITLHAAEGRQTSEGFFRAMALGPAESMDLPPVGSEYGKITEDHLRQVAELAERHGVHMLSPDEIRTRLPLCHARRYPETRLRRPGERRWHGHDALVPFRSR